MLNNILVWIQFFFSIIIGCYFLNLLRGQNSSKNALKNDSLRELEKLTNKRKIKLTTPLSENTRPKTFNEIIGQEDGIKAIKIALCSPNPQHILTYGPPGVGKTAAARVALSEAIESGISPFKRNAKFIEADATIMRFDERSIADPLIGSVHDPIYQGAGSYGTAGIPQPKEGAVTKAHGGVLFIDEIGELHPMQLNKLLKVLEDRRVMFESAYYSSEDKNIPPHIHDIFKNGLPADFRLIGATTRSPEDIPPALRSRCVEIHFKPLTKNDIYKIVKNAVDKSNLICSDECINQIATHSSNGRDAVKMVQSLTGIAALNNNRKISINDISWVIEQGHYLSRQVDEIDTSKNYVGRIFGLGVTPSGGAVFEIEASIEKCKNQNGKIYTGGIVYDEEISIGSRTLRKDGSAKSAVLTAVSLLEKYIGIARENYNITVNFPGGYPVDGPSAGSAIFCALYSAATNTPINTSIAMTGEISILGNVKQVGGVNQKIDAAIDSGIKQIYIPSTNYSDSYSKKDAKIVYVNTIFELLSLVFENKADISSSKVHNSAQRGLISADGT